jgi:hypothetical protein
MAARCRQVRRPFPRKTHDRPQVYCRLSESRLAVLLQFPQPPGDCRHSAPIRWIRLPLRIQSLHLIEFLGVDLRQVLDEQNQAPRFLGSVRFAEGWDAAQRNSILHCVVELAIALVVRPAASMSGGFG